MVIDIKLGWRGWYQRAFFDSGNILSPIERNHIKSGAVFWLKSLEMLDLPQKGLLQRSIVIDDRIDVWVGQNQVWCTCACKNNNHISLHLKGLGSSGFLCT